MAIKLDIHPTAGIDVESTNRWIGPTREGWYHAAGSRCTAEYLQKAVSARFDGVRVLSCQFNSTGRFDVSEAILLKLPGTPAYTELPPFYDLRLLHQTGPHAEHIILWLPAVWNGRYLASGGAGFRTDNTFGAEVGLRHVTLPVALKNGFAASTTNGGVSNPDCIDWLTDDQGAVDQTLLRNFTHDSIHFTAMLTKAVIAAVYDREPEYSYMMGSSSGGRQSLTEAMYYPSDFDGIWADAPAINFTKFLPAGLWPQLVMKEYGRMLTPPKLDAFRQRAIQSCGGPEVYYNTTACVRFPAEAAVGAETDAGPITAEDAAVMQRIWDGPRTQDGRFLWYGLRPGVKSWGDELSLLYSKDGVGLPNGLCLNYFRSWLVKDPAWDWQSLTFSQYETLFQAGIKEFASAAADHPDLSGFQAAGGKLILSHGMDDPVIFPEGTTEYYDRVVECLGGTAEAQSFIRLYLFPGNGHNTYNLTSPGFTNADGMAALMNWVEHGMAPEGVTGHHMDCETSTITGSKIFFPQ